jgi:NADPH:quinone reductase-like Zn-dependent oxidoreductase
VQVQAAGLNPVDYKMMANGVSSWCYPFIPGLDVAGVIDAIGEGVEGWQSGDKVFYHGNYASPGGFAEFAVTTSRTLVRTPEHLSAIHAAALPCAGFTAYQALVEKLNIQSGQTILVQGGAGGVGGFAIQIAAKSGLKVITTASSSNSVWVKSLGASWSIDYNTESIKDMIGQITNGDGVDAIIDTVGMETATEGLDFLAFNGGIACVARLPDLDKFRQLGKALSIHDINLGGAYRSKCTRSIERLGTTGQKFADFVGNMSINPMVTQVITLEQIPEALRRLSMRNVRGKIVAQLQS